jgi:hypothetical protein
MTEGVPASPHSDPMTAETTPHKYHDITTKTRTTQRKGGEYKQRKEVPIFPAINNFYACSWYPFYVVDTTVKHSASKLMMHQLTPTVSDCTVPKPSIVHDRTQTNLPVTVPYRAATNPTQSHCNQPYRDHRINRPYRFETYRATAYRTYREVSYRASINRTYHAESYRASNKRTYCDNSYRASTNRTYCV